MDFSAVLLAPIYATLGVPVTFTQAESAGSYSFTAIDKSAGVENPFGAAMDQTLVPAAVLRMKELTDAGLTRADIDRGYLVMNGKTWRVEAHRMKPTLGGEADGEVYLYLSEVA